MKRLIVGIVAGCAAIGAAGAEVAPDQVAFDAEGAVAASLTGAPGDPAEGRKVLANRALGNCVACHAVTEMQGDVQFHGDVGPTLDGAADRWSEAQLRGIVINAKHMFEGSMMPSFYRTSGFIRPGQAFTMKAAAEPLPPLLTAAQVEDVVAYLKTLKD